MILCHTTADFDTLGAAVGLSRLRPGSRIVLAGGAHPAVREFLALHRDEYALIERRSVVAAQIRSLFVVDTQWRDRLGKAAEWLDLPNIEITLYDHHLEPGDIPATQRQVEAIGAATTLIVEQLQRQQITPTPTEATVMALGIHVDTGSLTYDHTTVRDAAALTWLMGQGANLRAIADYVEPGLSQPLQDLLTLALDSLETEMVNQVAIASVLLTTEEYIPGLSHLAAWLMSLTESDVLLLAVRYPIGDTSEDRMNIIGRVRGGTTGAVQLEAIDLGELFQPLGGGGHAKAAAVTLRTPEPESILRQLLGQLKQVVPHPPTARELMSSPVRTIRPETSIAEAQRILLRYGHSGLSVVDEQDQLVGIISRRDIDIALHHGFSHAPVKGYMTPNLRTITPDTTLPEIESLMVTYDIGRLPVLDGGELVGIVTRTDVLRQLHREKSLNSTPWMTGKTHAACVLPERATEILQGSPLELLRQRLTPELWQVLADAAVQANQRGWQLYLVGGAVRDFLLADPQGQLLIDDVDLVVDGFHRSADQEAGVALARSLQQTYPQTRLQVHGRFQTAALLWHNDPDLDSLWIDIATARTEFYPYPAANPEVEASSIRQDLYRRDFTINALAVRLTPPRAGELLDFFGGLMDLQTQQIRVLHANSFIEDPTRIYRAVRFAVRLGFEIEPQTEGYIHHAIASGIYHRIQSEMDRTPALQTRLRRELKYILEAPYWRAALRLLDRLGALKCLHPDLTLSPTLWQQMRLVDRWLKRFDRAATLEHWLVLLEVLLCQLSPSSRARVADNLQLPTDTIELLAHLETVQEAVARSLPHCETPSQVVRSLEPYSLATLTLLAIFFPRPLRRQIWRYLTCWSTVRPPLDGNDLKAMGYKPGRQFREILDALTAATLDGKVGDRAAAEAFVKKEFSV